MKDFLEILNRKDTGFPVTPDLFMDIIHESPEVTLPAKLAKDLREYKSRLTLEKADKPAIIVGMGTCGLANGAQGVYDTFKEELEKRGIEAELISTGCVGYCAEEVIVDFKLPGYPRLSYARVTPRDVPNLIETTLINHEPVQDKVLGVYHEKVNRAGIICLSSTIFPFSKSSRKWFWKTAESSTLRALISTLFGEDTRDSAAF